MKKIIPVLLLFTLIISKDDIQYDFIKSHDNNTPSDSRWKTNVKNLDQSIEKITKLRGVTFEYKVKDFPEKNFDKGVQIGFIAQEVEPIIPELVGTDNKGYKTVDYIQITPLLVESIKELKLIIDQQTIKLDRMEKENRQLRGELNTLKSNVDKLIMDKAAKKGEPTTSFKK